MCDVGPLDPVCVLFAAACLLSLVCWQSQFAGALLAGSAAIAHVCSSLLTSAHVCNPPLLSGCYVNHSSTPNARLELWQCSAYIVPPEGQSSRQPWALIVTTEAIEAGKEIFVDFQADSGLQQMLADVREAAAERAASERAAASSLATAQPMDAVGGAADASSPAALSSAAGPSSAAAACPAETAAAADARGRRARTLAPPATGSAAVLSLLCDEDLASLGIVSHAEGEEELSAEGRRHAASRNRNAKDAGGGDASSRSASPSGSSPTPLSNGKGKKGAAGRARDPLCLACTTGAHRAHTCRERRGGNNTVSRQQARVTKRELDDVDDDLSGSDDEVEADAVKPKPKPKPQRPKPQAPPATAKPHAPRPKQPKLEAAPAARAAANSSLGAVAADSGPGIASLSDGVPAAQFDVTLPSVPGSTFTVAAGKADAGAPPPSSLPLAAAGAPHAAAIARPRPVAAAPPAAVGVEGSGGSHRAPPAAAGGAGDDPRRPLQPMHNPQEGHARSMQLPTHASTWGAQPGAVANPEMNDHFQQGDLVEVQEAYNGHGGGRQWFTGFVAYAWFEDFEPWTGYAIQFVHNEHDETRSIEDDFERRVPANRVRKLGGSPPAADAALVADNRLLESARALALQVGPSVGKPKGMAIFSNNGRLRRGAAPSRF